MIFGSDGSDTIRGGQGHDWIQGGGGADLLFGDLGRNTLTGGDGADSFHAGGGQDLILDFRSGDGDRVVVDPQVTWRAVQSGPDVTITFSTGGEMILQNVDLLTLGPGWIGAA